MLASGILVTGLPASRAPVCNPSAHGRTGLHTGLCVQPNRLKVQPPRRPPDARHPAADYTPVQDALVEGAHATNSYSMEKLYARDCGNEQPRGCSMVVGCVSTGRGA